MLRHGLELSLRLELSGRLLLPLFGAPYLVQVREEQLELHVERRVQVVGLNLDLCAEQPDVVNLDLLLAVADEERARVEAREVLEDLRLGDVVMVYVIRTFHFLLFLFVELRGEDTVGVRIVKL